MLVNPAANGEQQAVGTRCDGHPLCPNSSDHVRVRVGGGVIAFPVLTEIYVPFVEPSFRTRRCQPLPRVSTTTRGSLAMDTESCPREWAIHYSPQIAHATQIP